MSHFHIEPFSNSANSNFQLAHGTIKYKHFTLGIEEEYMVMDPHTRELKSHEQKIVTEGQKIIRDKVKAEMHQAVVEVGTDICENIEVAYRDVSTLRNTISKLQETSDYGLVLPEPIPLATGSGN